MIMADSLKCVVFDDKGPSRESEINHLNECIPIYTPEWSTYVI